MTDGKEETAAAISSAQAPNRRKRRLSKKERKTLKKKQKQSHKTSVPAEEANPEVPAPDEEDFEASYSPVPIPDEIKDGNDDNEETHIGNGGAKKLGKWFPEAVVIKTTTVSNSVTQHKKKNKKNEDQETRTSSLVLFYQYANPPFRQSQVRQLMTYFTSVAKVRNLGGRVRVSNEGVNCTLSSLATDRSATVPSAAANLRHFASDLRSFSPVFNDTDYKYIDDLPPDRHFKDLKILPVKELVFYGINEKDAPLSGGGVHLDAKDYHKMLARDDAVVIDVRNHYEAVIGRFDGQNQIAEKSKSGEDDESSTSTSDGKQATGGGRGATYIDPMMRKSTDFPDWLAKPETKEKLANKKVLMFCTGGVRCERASAYLKKQMGDQVDGVFQLKGGVERYMKEFQDGGFWRGNNFVFDKREAVSVDNVAGVGGVVRKQKGDSTADGSSTSNKATQLEDAKCCCCSKPWDRYVGKRKCDFCGVPVLMCDTCMTSHKGNKSNKVDIQCDLCKKEGVTVHANEVEWTDNGVHNCTDEGGGVGTGGGKAARSVLKWGGGHASEKKFKKKASRKPCRFGSECVRKDCMFYHPEGAARN